MRVEWVGGEDGLSDGGALGIVGGVWWGTDVGLVDGGAPTLGWWGWVDFNNFNFNDY